MILAFSACGGGDSSDDGSAGGAPLPGESSPAELFPTDLGQVCAGGTVSAAAEYTGAKGQIHPLAAFDGESGDYTEMTLDFPEGWTVMFPDYEKVELVACLERVADNFVKTCKGYESDDNPGETFSVELYNADYDVALYAAQSGEEVATTKLEAVDEDCPIIAFFDDGEKTQVEYATPDNLLRDFVKEYVAP